MAEQSDYDKLGEMLELTRENNRILRSMHRRMLWSQVFTFLYWCIILGVMGWSYYFLEPYLFKYWNMFQQLSTQLSGMQSGTMSFPADISTLLEKVR